MAEPSASAPPLTMIRPQQGWADSGTGEPSSRALVVGTLADRLRAAVPGWAAA